LEDQKSEITASRKETDQVRRDLDGEASRHRDTKDLLKQCEEKCTQLYQELISQNKSGVDRWTEIQRKYEDTQTLLQKQLAANEDLQTKLMEYKELNAQVEREWQNKYEQLQRDRDMIVETLKNGSERALHIVKAEYERKIGEIQAQAKEDIIKVDNMRTKCLSKYESLK
jgi:chromosome segregation ATPase